jgi:uncharacterized protein YciI
MKPVNSTNEQIAIARRLEKESRLSDAAVIYQKIFDKDPTDQQVIGRLLVMYRKLKEYKKELAVLDDAIAAYQHRQKDIRNKWIQSHPKAASAGKSMLRQLEKDGNALMGLGEGLLVDRWMKRRDFVTSRITGRKPKVVSKAGETKKDTVGKKKTGTDQRRRTDARNQQRERDNAAAARKLAAQERKDRIARQKKKESQRKAAGAARHPSLFVIIIRYLVSLEEIDKAMQSHVAYLDRHFDNGDFLVAGRQVPRTGGIIIAQVKDRNTLEKIIKQDPFVKRKLASTDIIEFAASKVGKGLF